MRSKEDIEYKKALKDAKGICCEIIGVPDFAFVSKVQLSMVVRHLVIEYSKDLDKKSEEINRLREELAKYKPIEQEEGGGQG